ncbi:MAG: hypothetical protein Q9201_001265 [Fulgogasparrea decipioides]
MDVRLTETADNLVSGAGVNIDLPEIVTDIAAGDLDLEAGTALRDHQSPLAAHGQRYAGDLDERPNEHRINRRDARAEEGAEGSGNVDVALTIE